MDQSEGIRKTYKERALPDALTCFQFVEEELKDLIIRCHDIIAEATKGKIEYRYSEESVRNAALETLIKWFRSYCGDAELIKALNKLKDSRNYIAHRGYIEISNQAYTEQELRDELNDLACVIRESKETLEKLKKFGAEL